MGKKEREIWGWHSIEGKATACDTGILFRHRETRTVMEEKMRKEGKTENDAQIH